MKHLQEAFPDSLSWKQSPPLVLLTFHFILTVVLFVVDLVLLLFCTHIFWRRKWQPTQVFLPGESDGQGSLVDCCSWSRKELNTSEWLITAYISSRYNWMVSPCRREWYFRAHSGNTAEINLYICRGLGIHIKWHCTENELNKKVSIFV